MDRFRMRDRKRRRRETERERERQTDRQTDRARHTTNAHLERVVRQAVERVERCNGENSQNKNRNPPALAFAIRDFACAAMFNETNRHKGKGPGGGMYRQ
jgi:hypothetical protein